MGRHLMMCLFLAGVLPTLALATPVLDSLSVEVQPKQTINETAEYTTQCKTCPYNLCTNVNIPWGGDNVTLSCWTNGDLIDDTDLWLKTTDNCYVTEYDLIEYPGDFSEDLEYCGEVPLDITQQPATVRYLSECKWGSYTSDESIKFYGRDVDVTLTCWSEGAVVMEDQYWYKTTDNCHVSGSGLWEDPDRDDLDNCGPDPGPRANETRRSTDSDDRRTTPLVPRWLQPEQIGEEYAPCYGCPATGSTGSACDRVTTYEFNDKVVSQCVTFEEVTKPNGSFSTIRWMLTTDWCYVDGDNFWVPPWDNYRYPQCDNWEGYD